MAFPQGSFTTKRLDPPSRWDSICVRVAVIAVIITGVVLVCVTATALSGYFGAVLRWAILLGTVACADHIGRNLGMTIPELEKVSQKSFKSGISPEKRRKRIVGHR